MNKPYLYNDKLTKTQKYLFSNINAVIGKMIDSYIIEGCSEEEAKELTYSKFMDVINLVYSK